MSAKFANLVEDAIDVYHKTGLTPRQLADQRAELLAALEKYVADDCYSVHGDAQLQYEVAQENQQVLPLIAARIAIARCKDTP